MLSPSSRFRWFILAAALATFISLLNFRYVMVRPFSRPALSNSKNHLPSAPASAASLPLRYFQSDFFYSAISQKYPQTKLSRPLKGGIVPHHLLASHLIAELFTQFASSPPQTLFIIGPNHTESGSFSVITSAANWQTPLGPVTTHQQIINRLVLQNLAVQDDHIMAADQSLADLIPFIRHYLPHTAIVPLLLSSHMDQVSLNRLAQFISPELENGAVIVASIDFSHGLPSHTASARDQVTWRLITESNLTALLQLDSQYLDSPSAIALLLLSLRPFTRTQPHLLNHTNAGQLTNNYLAPTTSYITALFY